jgi:micrococcal nuclease
MKTVPVALRALFLAVFAGPAALGVLSGANAECVGDDGGTSLLAEIRGGDTLILQDGRSVRLAGVLLPRRTGEGTIASHSREAAEKALAELVAGEMVELRLDARRRDRYGRVLAQLFVTKDGKRVWVQEQLVSAGLARVMSSRENRICVPDLLSAERTARETGQGSWRTGLFSIKQAASEDILSGLAQSYEIIEGRVENVAEVRGRIYVNFGKNWRRDFTVNVSSDAAKLFAEQSAVTGLRGRLVRVRGWIENVNGPSISLTHPEQLEILENGTAMTR